jgi:hypothetical protein
MKPNRSINYIRIVLVCWALALLTILLILPGLAKGISDPIQPEKLDIRPIPVPVSTPPMAMNQPIVSVTPAPSLLAISPMPQPIPVPTPAAFATPPVPSLAERQMPELSTAMTIEIVNRQEMIAMALMLAALLIWIWLHRTPSFHSLRKENA